jgi:hypothetical protein
MTDQFLTTLAGTSQVSARKQATRLVIEAYCPACNLGWDKSYGAFTVLQSAVGHTTKTGHVVVLNGASELPEVAENIDSVSTTPSESQSAGQCFYVDIPTEDCIGNEGAAWRNVAQCPTRKQAIEFAREHFGADDEGRICLISR